MKEKSPGDQGGEQAGMAGGNDGLEGVALIGAAAGFTGIGSRTCVLRASGTPGIAQSAGGWRRGSALFAGEHRKHAGLPRVRGSAEQQSPFGTTCWRAGSTPARRTWLAARRARRSALRRDQTGPS